VAWAFCFSTVVALCSPPPSVVLALCCVLLSTSSVFHCLSSLQFFAVSAFYHLCSWQLLELFSYLLASATCA
jgi:hypothetical protein